MWGLGELDPGNSNPETRKASILQAGIKLTNELPKVRVWGVGCGMWCVVCVWQPEPHPHTPNRKPETPNRQASSRPASSPRRYFNLHTSSLKPGTWNVKPDTANREAET